MPPTTTRMLAPLSGFDSAEASLTYAQLEDLTRRMRERLADITPEELMWQPAPGMNTIGMLLTHIAIVEVFWCSVLTERAFLCEQVLGVGPDDDGLPMPAGALPPPGLAHKALHDFFDLINRGRDFTRKSLEPLVDADLTREIEHRRRDGVQMLNGRWILYHLVEHLGGHFGQISLLRHWYRLARERSGASA